MLNILSSSSKIGAKTKGMFKTLTVDFLFVVRSLWFLSKEELTRVAKEINSFYLNIKGVYITVSLNKI